MPLTTTQLTNLRDAAAEAFKCEQATGIPCDLLIAQWADESGWGQHSQGNNCFGIKEYHGCSGTELLPTEEWFSSLSAMEQWIHAMPGRTAEVTMRVNGRGQQRYNCRDWFATFNSLSDCFVRRANLFNLGRYATYSAKFKQDGDLEALIQGIGPIYATDPDYSATLIRIASMPEVLSAIKLSRG